MVQNVLVAMVGGFAAALLFVAPFGGTPLAIPLFALTGLPIAIAGFGWGGGVALGAAIAGTALAFGFAGPGGGMMLALLFAAPTAWAALAATQPTTTPDGRGWRSPGLVLAHAAAASALGVIGVGAIAGFNPETLTQEITKALVDWAATVNPGPGPAPTAADVAPLVRLNVALLPATVGILAMAMVALGLYLGARSVAFSERLRRPLDPLWTVSLPAAVPAALVVATPLAFLPGSIGHAAGAVAGVFGAAVAMEGLAVIHALSRGISWRAPMLGALYALIFLSGLPIVLLALLGLAESAFHIRARRLSPRGPKPT
jgi:hypothetical protein